jgi:peptidoglycan hydrolase CwlO-like protein
MDPIILETMNDIINQIDRREWLRVNEHRDRVVKKWKREKAKVEEMKDEWEVATQKIAQENSDLHNEIKRLKDELRVKHPVIFQKTYQKQRDEIEKLKFNLQRAEDALDEQMEKNEDLMEKLTDK